MKKLLWAAALVGLMALWGWGRLLAQKGVRRRFVSPEAIEAVEAIEGYTWVSRLPQMRLITALAVARAVGKCSRGKAIDIGCGPGMLAIELARRAPGLEVVGLDLSEGMLETARENASRAGLAEAVTFQGGDALDIPFSDASFDLAVSTMSLHHWTEPVKVLNEIARILRPGGKFVVLDLRRDSWPFVWVLLWFATRFVVPAPLRSLGEPLGSLKAAYTKAELARLAILSHLPDWRIASGPGWLILESAR
ncbi:MAG: class I SAM-dependent methyltransferase [Chloroflexota bacterium]